MQSSDFSNPKGPTVNVTTDLKSGTDKIKLLKNEHDVLVKAQRLCKAIAKYEDTDAAAAAEDLDKLIERYPAPPAKEKTKETTKGD